MFQHNNDRGNTVTASMVGGCDCDLVEKTSGTSQTCMFILGTGTVDSAILAACDSISGGNTVTASMVGGCGLVETTAGASHATNTI